MYQLLVACLAAGLVLFSGSNYLSSQRTRKNHLTSLDQREDAAAAAFENTKLLQNLAHAALEDPTYIEVPKELLIKNSERRPEVYEKFTVDMFSHPKVEAAFQAAKSRVSDTLYSTCFGPEGNIDVFINKDLIKGDLLPHESYTVFNLDCRDRGANPLIAFIVVMNQEGEFVAVHTPPSRAEAVNMYSTDMVLFSCVGSGGVYLWNWKKDDVYSLPFDMDAHTVQYVPEENLFYGLEKNAHHSPSRALAVNTKGEEVWTYTHWWDDESSHINFITVRGDYAYISLRSGSSLLKLDKRTNEPIWYLGGDKTNDFTYINPDGTKGDIVAAWNHQHKFQFLDEEHVSLFNNNIDSEHEFRGSSEMLVLEINQEALTVKDVFRYDTGDHTMIYGGTDVLPTGNILGNSYPAVVQPSSEDRQYHVNLWEVTQAGELAWRVGFKGKNPNFPDDDETPHYHMLLDNEAPIGWVVYNVERAYDAPVFSQPCRTEATNNQHFVEFYHFNSVRTQSSQKGSAYLMHGTKDEIAATKTLTFHPSWLPSASGPTRLLVPHSIVRAGEPLKLSLSNEWGDVRVAEIGSYESLPMCSVVATTTDLRAIKASSEKSK